MVTLDQPLARRRTRCCDAVQRERATSIVIVGDAFAKPMLRASTRPPQRGEPYDLSSLEVIIVVGRDVDGRGQGAAARAHPAGRAGRRHRLDRGLDGHQHHACRACPPATAKFSQIPTTKVFTEDGREVQPGSGRDRHGRRRRHRAARLLQGRREVGAHVPGHRRRALLVPRRPGHGRRRRLADPARPRQPGDQHRRREGLPRGGRGGRQAGRPASIDCLVVGVDDERFGQAVTAVVSLDRRARRPTRPTSSPRSRRSWPATRRPSAWSSSPRCRGRPTARPTTARHANRRSPRAEAVGARPPRRPGASGAAASHQRDGAAPEPDEAGPSMASGAAASHQRARSRARSR